MADFPSHYDDILQLKGVGNYTASAIASFAYNLALCCCWMATLQEYSQGFLECPLPVDSTQGKLFFSKLANELLDHKLPAIYNQAIMDFGATICKPKLPLCIDLPVTIKIVLLITKGS